MDYCGGWNRGLYPLHSGTSAQKKRNAHNKYDGRYDKREYLFVFHGINVSPFCVAHMGLRASFLLASGFVVVKYSLPDADIGIQAKRAKTRNNVFALLVHGNMHGTFAKSALPAQVTRADPVLSPVWIGLFALLKQFLPLITHGSAVIDDLRTRGNRIAANLQLPATIHHAAARACAFKDTIDADAAATHGSTGIH